jgi:hypothetical protein
MKSLKLIISVLVVFIILNMSILSAVEMDSTGLGEDCKEADIVGIDNNTNKVLRLSINSENDVDFSDEITLNENDFLELKEMMNNLEEFLSENIDIFWKDNNFEEEEREEAVLKFALIIEKIRQIFPDLPDINIKNLLKHIFSLKISRVPIISIGYGNVLIRFYNYKTSLGRIFRPVFVKYWFGYSAMLNFNRFLPRGVHNSKLGAHGLLILGFKGFYINIGDAGLDHKDGMILLVGSSIFTPRFSSIR